MSDGLCMYCGKAPVVTGRIAEDGTIISGQCTQCGRENNTLYQRAVELWGQEAQIMMMAEEAIEVAKAAMKLYRGVTDDRAVAFVEELADVEIMVEQMRAIFGDENVDRIKKEKLVRLKNMLDEWEAEHSEGEGE